jgi:hypothetical protein
VRVFHFCRENGCYCLADSVLADPRAAGRPPLPIQQCRLSEIPRDVLRVECMRCTASSKFRRRMRSDFMDRMPSGRMSGSDCSTRLAVTARAGWRRMMLAGLEQLV